MIHLESHDTTQNAGDSEYESDERFVGNEFHSLADRHSHTSSRGVKEGSVREVGEDGCRCVNHCSSGNV